MASSSTSVPAASAAAAATAAVAAISSSDSSLRRRSGVSFRLRPKLKRLLLLPSKVSKIYATRPLVVKAQSTEAVGGSSNDDASVKTKTEMPKSSEKEVPGEQQSVSASLSEEAMSDFMTQVVSLVKLVDSRDIVELQLKQPDLELVIRKKEALPQPPAQAPIMMMHQGHPPAAMPPQYLPPQPSSTVPSPASAASAPAPPSAPKTRKSSHPPLNSPMSGSFYRSPGPGLPPFVKVGDKVHKGQVLCIIEAMKLMNEIEADHAGTVVEVLVDDGKPVGIDQPLFVIEP